MQTERKSKLYSIISILSAIGAIVSIWQTKEYYDTHSGTAAFHSFCNIGQTFDCTAVEISRFAEFFPNFPLSGVAIAGYLVIFILSLFGFSAAHRKNLKPYLVLFSSIALAFSIGYLIIMIGVVQKLCILCLCVDAINLSLFLLSLKLPAKKEETSGGMTFTHLIGTGIAACLIAFLFTKGLNPYADMKKEDVTDTIEAVLNEQPVQIQIPADAPVIGNPNAPITVVKFSDYECPACKIGATAIHPLFKRYPNEVKFVFVNYPLDQGCNPNIPRRMHEFACEAAEVAICATEQGKFLETYETLFENQTSFSQDKVADLLLSHVKGLDEAKLKACMKLPSTMDKISRDVVLGGKDHLNITSTPTFYINGKKIEGVLPTAILIQIIDTMLAQQKK